MSKTILVLGAGTGGIVTASELRKKAGKQARIILFEREDNNVFAPSLLWHWTKVWFEKNWLFKYF